MLNIRKYILNLGVVCLFDRDELRCGGVERSCCGKGRGERKECEKRGTDGPLVQRCTPLLSHRPGILGDCTCLYTHCGIGNSFIHACYNMYEEATPLSHHH